MTTGFSVLALGLLFAIWIMGRSRSGGLLALALCLGGAVLALAWRSPPEVHPAVPRQERDAEYTGSSACKACHGGQHASWQRSFHRSMTRIANEESLAFEVPAHLELDGRPYEIQRNESGRFEVFGPDLHAWGGLLGKIAMRWGLESYEGRIWSARAEDEVPRVRRNIVLVTGSHHYQAFWVEGGSGRELRQLPFVYLLDDALPEPKRWLSRRDAFLQPPDAPPHIARWNANCIQCHSVAGRPGHSETSEAGGRYDSSVADFGIGCEACHGPGRAHVQHYQSPWTRYTDRKPPRFIENPKRMSSERSSEVCGQCHSYFLPKDPDQWWESGHSESYRPGQSLHAGRIIVDYEQHQGQPSLLSRSLESVFWPDGTIRVGGREYNGLLRSPCFERGSGARRMSCISCHSMHDSDPNDQLAHGMEGQKACTQCHEALATRVEEHTHHPRESAGSLCYNCHMPRTTYALLKAIRSHRITSPVAAREARAAPNACNLCHLDRSLGWTEGWLARWYGQKEASESADNGGHLARDAGNTEDWPAAVTWLLAGNAAQRILLADGFAWPPAMEASGSAWGGPLLERLLDDPYAAVRHVATRSLRKLAEQEGATERETSPSWSRAELDALSRQRDDTPITISE